MKTLDEVIKAKELCELNCSDEEHCQDCPYAKQDTNGDWSFFCHDCEADALHYLKTIETTENLYHDAVNELSKWIDEDWKDRCLPLTWDELRQMEGKPVWIEWQDHNKEWFLIDSIDKKKVVFRSQSGFGWYCRRRENESWQAYRKERE